MENPVNRSYCCFHLRIQMRKALIGHLISSPVQCMVLEPERVESDVMTLWPNLWNYKKSTQMLMRYDERIVCVCGKRVLLLVVSIAVGRLHFKFVILCVFLQRRWQWWDHQTDRRQYRKVLESVCIMKWSPAFLIHLVVKRTITQKKALLNNVSIICWNSAQQIMPQLSLTHWKKDWRASATHHRVK